jgi:hypothetical protein
MNYLYSKLEYDAEFSTDTPERLAFAKHIEKVAKALHDIEWVDSSDYGPGDENEAIRDCLSDATIRQSSGPWLDLNEVRAEFAAYLASNANKRHSLDAALMHVVQSAYQKGMADAAIIPVAVSNVGFLSRSNPVTVATC